MLREYYARIQPLGLTFMTFYEVKYISGALYGDGFDAVLPQQRQ